MLLEVFLSESEDRATVYNLGLGVHSNYTNTHTHNELEDGEELCHSTIALKDHRVVGLRPVLRTQRAQVVLGVLQDQADDITAP